MQKTVFFFHRHPDRDIEDFRRHYLGNHAILGRRLTRILRGYTVNLVVGDGSHGPDAVTEHWVDDAMDLVRQEISYASDEDARAVATDDRTLFTGMAEPYVVVEEREIVPRDAYAYPLEKATPGFKIVTLHEDPDDLPEIASGATRVVDGIVGHVLRWSGESFSEAPSNVAVIRMTWTDSDHGHPDGAIVTREHRFITPHPWL